MTSTEGMHGFAKPWTFVAAFHAGRALARLDGRRVGTWDQARRRVLGAGRANPYIANVGGTWGWPRRLVDEGRRA